MLRNSVKQFSCPSYSHTPEDEEGSGRLCSRLRCQLRDRIWTNGTVWNMTFERRAFQLPQFCLASFPGPTDVWNTTLKEGPSVSHSLVPRPLQDFLYGYEIKPWSGLGMRLSLTNVQTIVHRPPSAYLHIKKEIWEQLAVEYVVFCSVNTTRSCVAWQQRVLLSPTLKGRSFLPGTASLIPRPDTAVSVVLEWDWPRHMYKFKYFPLRIIKISSCKYKFWMLVRTWLMSCD